MLDFSESPELKFKEGIVNAELGISESYLLHAAWKWISGIIGFNPS